MNRKPQSQIQVASHPCRHVMFYVLLFLSVVSLLKYPLPLVLFTVSSWSMNIEESHRT